MVYLLTAVESAPLVGCFVSRVDDFYLIYFGRP